MGSVGGVGWVGWWGGRGGGVVGGGAGGGWGGGGCMGWWWGGGGVVACLFLCVVSPCLCLFLSGCTECTHFRTEPGTLTCTKFVGHGGRFCTIVYFGFRRGLGHGTALASVTPACTLQTDTSLLFLHTQTKQVLYKGKMPEVPNGRQSGSEATEAI